MNWLIYRTPMVGGYVYSVYVHGWPTFSAQSMGEGEALAQALHSLPVPTLPNHVLRNWYRDGQWTQQNGNPPTPYIATHATATAAADGLRWPHGSLGEQA